MAKKQPFAKGKRVCIFCQDASGSRTSGEHVWPAWAAELLPKRDSKREYVIDGNAFQDNRISKLSEQQGSPSSFKDRVVCKKCNETWMSKLESDAKPTLKSIAFKDEKFISKAENKKLARWLFLKFCVKACCTDMNCVSQGDRTAFMNDQVIPRYFRSWIFTHNVDLWIDQNRWHSVRSANLPSDVRMDEPHNANTYALGFGRIIFFMMYYWNVSLHPSFPKLFATKIWPPPYDRITTPKLALVDEDEVNAVANLLPERAQPVQTHPLADL